MPDALGRARALAVLVLLLLPGAAGAQAEQRDDRLISLVPSVVSGEASGGKVVGPFEITNGTAQDFNVTVFPTELVQQREGGVVPATGTDARDRAAELLTAQVSQFAFPPGARRSVLARLGSPIARDEGVYLALMFRAAPTSPQPGQTIQNVYQLGGLIFLDPRRPVVSAKAGEPVFESLPRTRLGVTVPTRNTGNVRLRLGGDVTITDESDKVRAFASFEKLEVLPDGLVDLRGVLTEVLQAGRYTATIEIRARDLETITIVRPLVLFGPNEVRTEGGRLLSLEPGAPYFGEGLDVGGSWKNTGNVAFTPRMVAELRPVTEEGVGDIVMESDLSASAAEPGAEASYEGEIVVPENGENFELRVVLSNGSRILDERTTTIGPRDKPSLLDRFTDWIKRHLWVAALAILALLALAVFLALRAGRRRAEREIAAAQYGAVAPEASPGPGPSDSLPAIPELIDLNTATAVELQALPGIGPKLAQALIDHRQTHGGFVDVDELNAVPGFSDSRVEQIRERVRT